MAYQPGDKIFAKVKGHPHWPSRINLLPPDVTVPKGKYPIFFYGTHEVYYLAPKDIYPYEKFKSKYGVKRSKLVFQEGLREIEENPDVLLYGKDPDAEAFLAQFYKFTPSKNVNPPATPGNKRTGSPSEDVEYHQPAKKPHIETTKPSSQKRKKPTPKSSQRQRKSKAPDLVIPPVSVSLTPLKSEPPSNAHSDTPPKTELKPRISSLRVKIRKSADGLKYSSAYEASSSVSSSTSPKSSNCTEQLQTTPTPDACVQVNAADPLRITIKQISTSSSTSATANGTLAVSHPVFSVTPVRTEVFDADPTAPTPTRKRSTAVVNPLRREGILPDLSDDSLSGISNECEDENKPGEYDLQSKKSDRQHRPRLPNSSPSSTHTRKKLSKKHKQKISIGPTMDSDVGNLPSVLSPRTVNKPDQVEPVNKSHSTTNGSPSSKIPMTKGSDLSSPLPSSNPLMPSGNDSDIRQHQQEQKLKELDTEARLLLIDRSIKSSLVRDHEDVATCVDRLEMLDRIPITLPVLAKCWIIVETIRKCRRYKRSMEVKIAAQKVFNKFLQLYANAEKSDLDLAHAELVRHQERYAKQHPVAGTGGNTSQGEAVHPPYSGPRSMADLFQVSAAVLADKQRQNQAPSCSSIRTPAPSSPPGSTKPRPPSPRKEVSPTASKPDESEFKRSISEDIPSIDSLSTPASGSKTVGTPGLPDGISIEDIPLPKDPVPNISKPLETERKSTEYCHHTSPSGELRSEAPLVENTEEEFEVLDEYEEASFPRPPTNQVSSDGRLSSSASEASVGRLHRYIPGPAMDSTTVVPFSVVQPPFVPAPSSSFCNNTCTLTSAPVPALSTTYVVSFPTSASAIPYPFVTYPQVIQGPPQIPPPAPYISSVQQSQYQIGSEVTPPQLTSRAYIPYSLHPSTDPPPPYRPYVPTRCDIDQSVVDYHHIEPPVNSLANVSQPNMIPKASSPTQKYPTPVCGQNPTPLSSPRHSSACGSVTRSEDDHYSRSTRHIRPNRRRTRSPHALPHPLEHYQRYLVSALEDEHHESDRVHQKSGSKKDDDLSRITAHTEPSPDRKGFEDLDARIARLFGVRGSSKSVAQPDKVGSTRRSPHALLSPPPPPPPPTTSQRILFTHRPQLSPPVSGRSARSSSSHDRVDRSSDQNVSGARFEHHEERRRSSDEHFGRLNSRNLRRQSPNRKLTSMGAEARSSDGSLSRINDCTTSHNEAPDHHVDLKSDRKVGNPQYPRRLHPERYQSGVPIPSDIDPKNRDCPPIVVRRSTKEDSTSPPLSANRDFRGTRKASREDDRDLYSMLGV
ncbi:unnamed protein product [Calicophoron daubneyi]|uniref:PWWP domain-containing protein n=1 Tax=Calicophoron daubneyi TaxID=300641 RepID=A0AAV2TNB7_CALDB